MSACNGNFPEHLRELCRRLAAAEDLRAGVQAAAWACDGAFPFYRAALALPDRSRDRLYVAAAWARCADEELEGYDFDVRGHPLEQVVRGGAPLVRTDPLHDHGDLRLARLFEGEGKAEELAVPLDLGGRRGLLAFASREQGAFDATAVAHAEDVARLVSIWARPWSGPDAPAVLKDQYQALLEGALDGIAVLVEGQIAYANPSFREIFGISARLGAQGRFVDLIRPDSQEAFLEALEWVERRARALPRLEVQAQVPHRDCLHLDLGVQRILYQGQPAVLLQVHNATERADREREARDAFARVDVLLHTLAHDVRGPLTAIVGFSDLLLERQGAVAPEQVNDMLGVVGRSCRSLKHLVEGVMEYSSLGSNRLPVVDVALEHVLATVEAEIEGLLRSSGARIEYRHVPAAVRGRPVELARVFKNLIENGIRYARPGVAPRIRVSGAGEAGQFQELCVEDNGVGIEPQRLGEVFELFRRGPRGGCGVGLSIAERIVRLHGGRMWVESEPGAGSRFYFTLPTASGSGV